MRPSLKTFASVTRFTYRIHGASRRRYPTFGTWLRPTKCSVRLSGWDITIVTRLRSFSETCWKTRRGIPPIPPIKRKLLKDAWKPSSISKPWWPISPASPWPMLRFWTRRPRQQKPWPCATPSADRLDGRSLLRKRVTRRRWPSSRREPIPSGSVWILARSMGSTGNGKGIAVSSSNIPRRPAHFAMTVS